MERTKRIIVLLITISMLFTGSGFSVFADAINDQQGTQVEEKAAPSEEKAEEEKAAEEDAAEEAKAQAETEDQDDQTDPEAAQAGDQDAQQAETDEQAAEDQDAEEQQAEDADKAESAELPDTKADVEKKADWEKTLPAKADRDVLSVAKSQLGYKESKDNYKEAKDGSHNAYTRYGAFMDDEYAAPWDACFVQFVLHYAGIKGIPEDTDTVAWLKKLENADLTAGKDYTAVKGDVVFFSGEEDVQTAIVSKATDGELTVIGATVGEDRNKVSKQDLDASDVKAVVSVAALQGEDQEKVEEKKSDSEQAKEEKAEKKDEKSEKKDSEDEEAEPAAPKVTAQKVPAPAPKDDSCNIVKSVTELQPRDDNNTHISVSGMLPENAVVKAYPVRVSVPGQIVLVSYDITIYEPQKDGSLKEWQPKEPVQVSFRSDALKDAREVNVYHMENTEDKPVLVTSAEAESGDVDFTAESFSIYLVTENPHWEIVFKNGDDIYCKQLRDAGNKVIRPTDPVRKGAVFSHWAKEDDTEYDFDQKLGTLAGVTKEMTLHAVYSGDKVNITYFDQNGAIAEQQVVSKGSEVNSADVDYTPIQNKQNVYLNFVHWTLDPSGDKANAGTFTATEDTELYPVVEEGHWINFDGNKAALDGSVATYVKPVFVTGDGNEPGDADDKVGIPTATGHSFLGWFTRKSGGKQVFDAEGLRVDQNYNSLLDDGQLTYDPTLYAQWETGTADYQVVYYVQKASDVPNAATKHYEFYKVGELREGLVGDMVSVDATKDSVNNVFTTQQDRWGFVLNTAKSADVEVKADGSTVLSVYFDRNTYSLVFKNYQYEKETNPINHKAGRKSDSALSSVDTVTTITELYGHDISGYFPVVAWESGWFSTTYMDYISWCDADQTSDASSGIKNEFKVLYGMPALKPASKGVDYLIHNKSTKDWTTYYYREVLPGTHTNVTATAQGSDYILYKGLVFEKIFTMKHGFEMLIRDTHFQDTMEGFEPKYYTPSNIFTSGQNKGTESSLFYARRERTIILVDPTGTKENQEVKFKYGETVTENKLPKFQIEENDHLEQVVEDAYWFNSPSFGDGSRVDFSNFTMPNYDITLYAGLKEAYDVTFDPGDGQLKNEEDALLKIDKGKSVNPAEVIQRPGYSFVDWFQVKEDGTLENHPYNFSQQVQSNMTLRAKWRKEGDFRIVYDAGEGVRAPKDENIYADGAHAVAEASLDAPAGERFVQWKDKAGNTYKPGQEIAVCAEIAVENAKGENIITLTADCEQAGENQNEVADYTFLIGENSPIVKTISSGDKLEAPAVPQMANKKFTGWYLDSACTRPFTEFGVINHPVYTTLYAGFQAQYTVTYYADSSKGQVVSTQIYQPGKKLNTSRVAYTPIGEYQITGWTDGQGHEYAYQSRTSNVVESDMALWPVLKHQEMLRFDTDGGTTIEAAPIPETRRLNRPANPEKRGFLFQGWFTAKEGGEEYDFNEKLPEGVKVLYARWAVDEAHPLTGKLSVYWWAQRADRPENASQDMDHYELANTYSLELPYGEYTLAQIKEKLAEKNIAMESTDRLEGLFKRYKISNASDRDRFSHYFQYMQGKSDQNVVVNDKDNILNLRFDRQEYTLVFNLDGYGTIKYGKTSYSGSNYRFKVWLDKDILAQWPIVNKDRETKDEDGSWPRAWIDTSYDFGVWAAENCTNMATVQPIADTEKIDAAVKAGNKTLTYQFTTANQNQTQEATVHYYLDGIEEEDYKQDLKILPESYHNGEYYATDSNNVPYYSRLVAKDIEGYSPITSREDAFTTGETAGCYNPVVDNDVCAVRKKVGNIIHLYFYYKAEKNELRLWSRKGTLFWSKEVSYGTQINGEEGVIALENVGTPAAPAGKEFNCWSTSSDAAVEYYGTMPAYTIDLFAAWNTIQVSVTTEGIDILGFPSMTSAVYGPKDYGTTLEAFQLADPTKEGQEFVGWVNKATGNLVSRNTRITEDMTLVARWRDSATRHIVYDKNGGSGSVPADGNEYLASGSAAVMDGAALTKQCTDINGQTYFAEFAYWSTKQDGTGSKYYPGDTLVFADEAAVEENGKEVVRLYAIYAQRRQANLVYSKNAPQDDWTALFVATDENESIQTTWMDEKEFVKVSFDDNVETRRVNTPAMLGTDNNGHGFTVIRAGYKLAGWARSADAKEAEFPVDAKVRVDNIGAENGNNILYAVWEKDPMPVEVYTYENGHWEDKATKIAEGGCQNFNPSKPGEWMSVQAVEGDFKTQNELNYAATGYAFGFGMVDGKTVEKMRYTRSGAGYRWEYAAEGEGFTPLGDHALQIYYFKDSVDLPVYYVSMDENGQMQLIAEADMLDWQGARWSVNGTDLLTQGVNPYGDKLTVGIYPFTSYAYGSQLYSVPGSGDGQDNRALYYRNNGTLRPYKLQGFVIGEDNNGEKMTQVKRYLKMQLGPDGMMYGADDVQEISTLVSTPHIESPAIYVVYGAASKLTVKNTLTGEYANMQETFPVQVKLQKTSDGVISDSEMHAVVARLKGDDSDVTVKRSDDKRILTVDVELGHEGEVVIDGLGSGWKYSLTESNTKGYTVSCDKSEVVYSGEAAEAELVSGATLDGDTAVQITNTLTANEVPATGVDKSRNMAWIQFLLILAIAVLAAVGGIYMKVRAANKE